MSGHDLSEDKNEEATAPIINEPIETTNEEREVFASRSVSEQPTEQIKQEETITPPIEQNKKEEQPTAKAKTTTKARTVKVVELVDCDACNKKMLPKSLKHTHPHYCKGAPTETLPVNKQKASYGSKVEQKLRKEIEEEMKAKYAKHKETEQYSEPIEVKTKTKPSAPSAPSVPSVPSVVKQLTTRELLEASYNEIRKAKREVQIQKINGFKSKMF